MGVAQVQGLKSTIEFPAAVLGPRLSGNERQTMVPGALSKSNRALPLVDRGASSARWLGPKFWVLEKLS